MSDQLRRALKAYRPYDGEEERERQVILLRYSRNLTQEKAARVLGVSQVQVSRIERRAMESLRRKLEE